METITLTNKQNVNNLDLIGNAAPLIFNDFLNFPQEAANARNNDDILNELGIDINSFFNEKNIKKCIK